MTGAGLEGRSAQPSATEWANGEVPFVSVVVPVRNGETTIGDCLQSLMSMDYPAVRHEILVVDNGSTDGTAAVIERFPVGRLWEPEPGASNARNRGLAESRGDIVAFIDADCVASRGWLREMVGCFEDEDVAGAAGEILSYPPTSAAGRYMAVHHAYSQKRALEGPWPFAATGNVAFRRAVFERIGHFDPRLPSAEDKDFSRRFLDAGIGALCYCPRGVVLHRFHETVGGFFRQQMHWIYGAALLHAKYDLPWRLGDEARKYGTLLTASGALAVAAVRRGMRRADAHDLSHAYFGFLRELAFRLGAARWWLQRRRLTAPFRQDAESAP